MYKLIELDQRLSHDAIDDRIRHDVERELADTKRTSLRQIRCDCQHGTLQLHGQVDTFFLKQLAQEHARRVHGVCRIVNHIHVVGN